MDTETINNQITGLKERHTQLSTDEKAFIEAKGIQVEEEKIRGEIQEKTATLESKLEDVKTLTSQKAKAMNQTCKALSEKMSEFMPYGEARFEIDDGKVFIEWGKTPYIGLSGGEKVAFDAALTYALESDLLIMEAAEMDEEKLEAVMKRSKDSDKQIIINTWHSPSDAIEEWDAVWLE